MTTVAQLSTDSAVCLRGVQDSDWDFLYHLYCDPEVRENSRIHACPAFQEFKRWVQDQPFFYTVTWRGLLVGYGRVTPLPITAKRKDVGEVSYALVKEARGKGWASDVIRLLGWHAAAIGLHTLTAEIRPMNIPSLRALLRAGFHITLPLNRPFLTLERVGRNRSSQLKRK